MLPSKLMFPKMLQKRLVHMQCFVCPGLPSEGRLQPIPAQSIHRLQHYNFNSSSDIITPRFGQTTKSTEEVFNKKKHPNQQNFDDEQHMLVDIPLVQLSVYRLAKL